jgi:hypothetical protein
MASLVELGATQGVGVVEFFLSDPPRISVRLVAAMMRYSETPCLLSPSHNALHTKGSAIPLSNCLAHILMM